MPNEIITSTSQYYTNADVVRGFMLFAAVAVIGFILGYLFRYMLEEKSVVRSKSTHNVNSLPPVPHVMEMPAQSIGVSSPETVVVSTDVPSSSERVAGSLEFLAFAGRPTNDLKIVEGIGPKIEELLKNNSIHDWGQLAGAEIGQLKSILAQAGTKYKMHDPSTWPYQAKLAKDGEWQKLAEYQDFLNGGRE